MAKKDETPGQKAERERLERKAESDRLYAESEARRKRESRRFWPSSQAPESGANKAKRAQRDKDRAARKRAEVSQETRETEVRLGQNERSVLEFLKRNPEARPTDIAFRAIYGGGTTAWEGLHRKTRANATAETSRVLARLKAKGEIKIIGYTLGGKPKYAHKDYQPPGSAGPQSGGGSSKKSKKSGSESGSQEESKPTLGELLGLGDSGNQGNSLGELLGLGKSNPPDDDNGGDDDKGQGFLKPSF